jgi:hypothetical protein
MCLCCDHFLYDASCHLRFCTVFLHLSHLSHSYTYHEARCVSKFSKVSICKSQSPQSKLVVEHFPTCTCIVSKSSPRKRQSLHLNCLKMVLSNECISICFFKSLLLSNFSSQSSHFLGYCARYSVCFLNVC